MAWTTPGLREEIARVADKATAYTMEFRRLRRGCVFYGECPSWHQEGCLHKNMISSANNAGMCHPLVCPLKEV